MLAALLSKYAFQKGGELPMKQWFENLNKFMDGLNNAFKVARKVVQSLMLLLLDVATLIAVIKFFF